MKKNFVNLYQDAGIIFLSVLVAVILWQTGILLDLLNSVKQVEFVGSFIAGLFFTSIFTAAPAVVALGEISRSHSLLVTAFVGSLGSVVGDLIIFHFIKDRFAEHFKELFVERSFLKMIKRAFRFKFFRWLNILVGCLLILSPLPDELGISLLGLSKTKISLFVFLSLVLNFLGILLIGWVARAF